MSNIKEALMRIYAQAYFTCYPDEVDQINKDYQEINDFIEGYKHLKESHEQLLVTTAELQKKLMEGKYNVKNIIHQP